MPSGASRPASDSASHGPPQPKRACMTVRFFQESVLPCHRVRVGLHGQGIGSALLDIAKSESAGELALFTFARNWLARRAHGGQLERAHRRSMSSRSARAVFCAAPW